MSAPLSILGGTVVTADGVARADVHIADGRIASIGDGTRSARTVDAGGLYVLAGFVDTHVHLMDPGPTEREDFPTGTSAAAARGVTTIVEHTHARPIRTAAELDEKRRYLEGRSRVDFGLAAHVWPDRIDRLGEVWASGATFFKAFTCTTHGVPGLDEADLRRAFREISSFGGTCLVHCEDEAMTADAERQLRAAGESGGSVLPRWRSREAERAAVEMTAEVALETGTRATVAHVSSPEIASIVARARDRGARVAAEACPQYLLLREDEVETNGPLRKFTPPARSRSQEDEDAMWRLLAEGVLTHVSTDHAPSTKAQKLAGDIWDAPFGLPGLDTTSRVLIDAVARGRIRWEDVAARYSERPAKLYGLWPRKGGLHPGADADLVLVDPDADVVVRDEDVLSKAGWSPFAGRRFRGDVVATWLRGEQIAEGGEPFDELRGRFVAGPGAAEVRAS